MAITWGQAKQMLAQYVGRGGNCPSTQDLETFVTQVLQKILFKGQYGSLRKFTFQAVRGVFTIPYDLEVIEQVQIDKHTASTWNKWFDFRSGSTLDKCLPRDKAITEISNYWPTVFDLPRGGAYVATLGICTEAADAHIIVKGKDLTGREVYTIHNGERIVGEYLSIKKQTYTRSQVMFGEITDIVKSPTSGYVQLAWFGEDTKDRGFLADYSPYEEYPQYRRYKLTITHAPICEVTVLGRIRLKDHYADNDVIFFDNINTLVSMAQSINLDYNNEVQLAQAKEQNVVRNIQEENQYKTVNNGQPINVYNKTSAGSIRNIIGRRRF